VEAISVERVELMRDMLTTATGWTSTGTVQLRRSRRDKSRRTNTG